jgi:hypothetical protein
MSYLGMLPAMNGDATGCISESRTNADIIIVSNHVTCVPVACSCSLSPSAAQAVSMSMSMDRVVANWHHQRQAAKCYG